MIVVLLIGILLAIMLPNLYTARQRSRASALISDLREIDAAKQQLVLANNLAPGAPVNDAADLVPNYLKEWPTGPVSAGSYSANPVNTNPTFLGHDEYWYEQNCTGTSANSSCPL